VFTGQQGSTLNRLPSRPDFQAIEAVSHKSAGRRTEILALIGNLVYSWSNNESMFVYVIMLLLNTDQTSATIVFASLNTTRARIDLVQRLAAAKITSKSVAKRLAALIDRFNECTRFRNEFNHCSYTVSESGEITHTQVLRLQERRGRLELGQVRRMDDARLKAIVDTINELRNLNRELWDILPELEKHMAGASRKRS
jgi:hypothetical protein